MAQQIVAETAARDWNEDDLFQRFRQALPYGVLTREDFDAVLNMLAQGFSARHGRRGALIHRDAINHVIRGREARGRPP